ncbi:hypothetical protein EB241_04270 [Erwinia psidii]|uniref:Uncharacterized protein n=1 Tax=Erwinia psidii TaxID=69224 RepID=A0A3N6UUM0_9GAMM|nr:hypothetical protein EB241_04270 [Erwinia psidii]
MNHQHPGDNQQAAGVQYNTEPEKRQKRGYAAIQVRSAWLSFRTATAESVQISVPTQYPLTVILSYQRINAERGRVKKWPAPAPHFTTGYIVTRSRKQIKNT